NWNTASNWSPAAVPGASDEAIIAAGGIYAVTESQTNTVGSLDITNPLATLAIAGGQLTVLGTLSPNVNDRSINLTQFGVLQLGGPFNNSVLVTLASGSSLIGVSAGGTLLNNSVIYGAGNLG